jgi:hypothetical protein
LQQATRDVHRLELRVHLHAIESTQGLGLQGPANVAAGAGAAR